MEISYLVLASLLCARFVVSEFRFGRLQKLGFENIETTANGVTQQIRSFISCSRFCVSDSDCLTVSYDVLQRRCILYSKELISTDFNVNPSTVLYYGKIVSGLWGPWLPYSACSVTCDGGHKIRTRNCDSPAPAYGGDTCPGTGSETLSCNTQACPEVDGNWGSWSSYGTCTVTCGGGTKTRTRACDNPVPANGGATCPGSPNETPSCNTSPCPVDGNWGSWSSFGSCTVTCGGGTQTRTRACDTPVPTNGGNTCSGSSTDNQACNPTACPMNGNWGPWSSYGSCTVTCGSGTQTRSRSCDNPAPANGGASCSGSSTEDQQCTVAACQVNGNWGSWSSYGSCTVTCGGGTQTRSRPCDNPAPANGGATCVGDTSEDQPCSITACPVIVNGNWGSWSSYGSCTVTCAGGTQTRSRSCNDPAPANGGATCVGDTTEDQTCNTNLCPINGNWGSWSGYASCPVTCGGGTKARSRSCNNPAPSHGGTTCQGPYSQDEPCNTHLCPAAKCASYAGYSFDQSTGACITISSTGNNFDGALSACTGNSATLFKMDSEAKRDYVKQLLTLKDITDDSIFIGAKDKSDTETFVWMDDTPVSWIGTLPTAANQDCVRIDTTKNPIEMDETPCSNNYKYICEKSV